MRFIAFSSPTPFAKASFLDTNRTDQSAIECEIVLAFNIIFHNGIEYFCKTFSATWSANLASRWLLNRFTQLKIKQQRRPQIQMQFPCFSTQIFPYRLLIIINFISRANNHQNNTNSAKPTKNTRAANSQVKY